METMTGSSSDDTRLVFDVWRGGDTWALLVHGLSSNAQTWWQVASRLADNGTSVITVDQRSHGRSELADGSYEWAVLASDLIRVLDRVGVGMVLAAGQSWGANVVLETATRHPDRIGSCVSVDGAYTSLRSRFPDWDTCREALRPPHIPPTTPEAMRRYLRDAHPHWSDAGIDGTVANFRLAEGLLHRALPIPHHMKIVRHLWDHDPLPLYGELDRPALVVTAGTHREAPDIGGAEVMSLPGHHDLHVEQPDALAAILADRIHRWAG